MYEWALLNAKRFDGDSCKTLLIDIYPAAAASILSEYSVTCNDQLVSFHYDFFSFFSSFLVYCILLQDFMQFLSVILL